MKKGKRKSKHAAWIAALLLCAAASFLGMDPDALLHPGNGSDIQGRIPAYSGDAVIELNHNRPFFDEEDLTEEPFEQYSPQDNLGRCGTAYANICRQLMPTKKRESIGMIRPTGWKTSRYDDLITSKYLYNRCHLIAYSLSGENANERNLITGTRFMNENMIPYETAVADYVRKTNHHVLYRVTPVFKGKNLLADGVEMEAMSVEDRGAGISFHVYLYNVQPGVEIDYATGNNKRAGRRPAKALK